MARRKPVLSQVVALVCAGSMVASLGPWGAMQAAAEGSATGAAPAEAAATAARSESDGAEGRALKEYPVSDVESLESVVDEIYHDADVEEAIILLTADVKNAPQNDGVNVRDGYPFVGVPGKRVIVRSAPDAVSGAPQWHSIYVGTDIVGDVVFDNVHAFGRIVFANGHHFETTENCRAGKPGEVTAPCYFGMIFGGGHRAMPEDKESGTASGLSEGKASVEATDLVLGGNVHAVYVFGGGYFSDVAGDTSVRIQGETVSVDYLYGGGVARTLSSDGSDPSGSLVADVSKGAVGGSTLVSLAGSVRAKRVFGGGCESKVAGSAQLVLDGEDVKVQELYGGGMAQDTAGGTVGGDASTTVRRGEVRAVVAGGANWGRGDRSAAAVAGTARATFGFKNASEGSVLLGTDFLFDGGEAERYCFGGSLRSTVGNVSLKLLEGTTVQGGNLCGCGASDTVRGAVDVQISGADTSSVFLLGGGIGSSSDAATDKTIRILNQGKAENALRISYDAPSETVAGKGHGIFAGSALADMSVNGKVSIEMRSGTLDFVHLDNYQDGTLTTRYDISSDTSVLVAQGNVYNIRASAGDGVRGEKRLVYDGCGAADNPQKTGWIAFFDSVDLRNNAYVKIYPDRNLTEGARQVPFYDVEKLTVAKGSSLTAQSVFAAFSAEQGNMRLGRAVVEGSLTTLGMRVKASNGEVIAETPIQIRDVAIGDGGVWTSKGFAEAHSVSVEKGGTWSVPSFTYGLASVSDALSNKGIVSFNGPFVLGKDHAAETGVIDDVVLDCDGGSFSVGPLAKENGAVVSGSTRISGTKVTLESPLHVRGNWSAADAIVCVAEDAAQPLLCIDDAACGMTGIAVVQPASDGGVPVEVVPTSGKSYLSAGAGSEAGSFFFANADATAPNGKGLFLAQGDRADGQWAVAQGIAVRFDAGMGSRTPYWATGSTSSPATFPLPDEPMREGYIFRGWNTKADGSGDVFTAATPLTSSATVYAQWEKKAGSEGSTDPGNTPTTPGPGDAGDSKPTSPTPGGSKPVVPDSGSTQPTVPGASSKPSQSGPNTSSKPSSTPGGSATSKPSSPSSSATSGSSSTASKKPPRTAIKKLKKAKRGFTVTWKKLSKSKLKKITGYQVRYSTKKSMKGAKKKTVKATTKAGKKCTLKVTRLKASKKYYVQVRTYKKVKGKTIYSSWSKAKAVKTKR